MRTPIDGGKTDERPRKKRDLKPKNVIYVNATLACQRCVNEWDAVDLNPEHKRVICPVCAAFNDIRDAIKRAS